jgi:predicted MFS family arabinose efflux permease
MSIRNHRDFLRIWSGQAVSNLGDGVHRIAILWWARQATGSNLAVVAVALATTIPSILAAPFAGWLVDRMDRRHLMLWADGMRVGTSGALAGLAAAGALHLWMVLVVAVVSAAAGTLFSPAYMASITMLVPADDRAVANSMVGINEATAGILGPAVGGLLIGLWGTSAALWFDAGTFVVSLLFVLASRIPMPPSAAGTGSDGADDADAAELDTGLLAGLRLVRKDRNLRDLTAVAVGLNTFVAPVPVLIVALAAGPFALGGTGYGLLEAAIPAGLLLGFVLGPKVVTIRPAAFVALLFTSIGLALAGATTVAVVGGLTFLAAGVGVGVVNTVLPTRFQQDVDPAIQGRVFALLGGLMQVGRPLGLVLAAPLIAGLGPRWGLAVCGGLMLAVTWFGRSGVLGPVAAADYSRPDRGSPNTSVGSAA